MSRTRRNKAGIIVLALGWVGLSLLISASARAQVAGATLSGTLTDSSGGVIPNGQVSIKNTATGVVRNVATDTAGFYTAPNLLPGTYEVTVTAAGFATSVQSGITLTVGAQQRLNFALQVGQVAQTVRVTAEAPPVELATSSVSAVVASNTVVELPLNGRNWGQLAQLQPGVDLVQTQDPISSTAN